MDFSERFFLVVHSMNTVVDLELCPNCCTSIPITSYASPFDSVLSRAHYNPSGNDITTIERHLGDPRTEIALVALEIQRVDSILQTLKNHHVFLEKHISQNLHFLHPSPIRQMPTEVLNIIFSAACTSVERSEYKTPLSISLVCSKWRAIAISTPELWTRIYVGPDRYAPDLFQHFLGQCGSTLSFDIKIDKAYKERPIARDSVVYEDSYEHHVAGLADVYRTYRRWRTVELHMHVNDLALMNVHITPFELEGSDPLGCLESVTLKLEGCVDSMDVDLSNVFSHAPNFHTVTLLGCTRLQRLPWTQVRHVITDQHNLADVRNINEGFPGKMTLCGSMPQLAMLAPGWATPSCMLNITALAMDPRTWSSGVADFFRWISIPALKDLELVCPEQWTRTAEDPTSSWRVALEEMSWRNALQAVPELIRQSGCDLRSFRFRMSGEYTESHPSMQCEPALGECLVEVLGCMPGLEVLQVVEAVAGPKLLTPKMFGKMKEGGYLEKLKAVELVWAQDRQPEVDLVQAFMGHKLLASVVVGMRNGASPPAHMLHDVQSLRRRGIDVRLW